MVLELFEILLNYEQQELDLQGEIYEGLVDLDRRTDIEEYISYDK